VSTEAPRGPAFDPDRPWRLDERVAVRPEPFGALLYHFGTRRLSFLKNATVPAVVRSLAECPSARQEALAEMSNRSSAAGAIRN
jgi:putative mycofactocin binding protein MftB